MEFRIQPEGNRWVANSVPNDWVCVIEQSGQRFPYKLSELSSGNTIGGSYRLSFDAAVESSEELLANWLSLDEEE